MKIRNQIPDFYSQFLPQSVLGLEIIENKANCEHCYMAHHKKKNEKRFDETLKCCTYYPMMPNYLVGGLMMSAQTSEEAKKIIHSKISKRHFNLPIGMVAPVRYQVTYKKNREEVFGLDESYLCPYFNKTSNNCGVWKFRSSVCTSFFCVSDYGKKGKQFWSLFEDYLSYVEMALLQEALVRMDFSPRQISEQMMFLNRHEGKGWELSQDTIPIDTYKKLWNGFDKDPVGFYQKSYEIVQSFKRKDYAEIMGEIGLNVESELLKQEKLL